MDKIKTWWNGRKESTKRAIKTLAETFVGTFLVVFCGGLTNGLVDVNALKALAIAALSAAVAAVAAKLMNLGHDIVDDADKTGETKTGGTD